MYYFAYSKAHTFCFLLPITCMFSINTLLRKSKLHEKKYQFFFQLYMIKSSNADSDMITTFRTYKERMPNNSTLNVHIRNWCPSWRHEILRSCMYVCKRRSCRNKVLTNSSRIVCKVLFTSVGTPKDRWSVMLMVKINKLVVKTRRVPYVFWRWMYYIYIDYQCPCLERWK